MTGTTFKPIDLYRDCNSYEIAPALIHNHKCLPYSEWLRQVGEHWSGMDNISQHRHELIELLCGVTPVNRHLLMTDEENAAFNALPEVVTIYRGCYEHNKHGMSWSLCRDVAEGFTKLNRYRHNGLEPLLLKTKLPKACGFLKMERKEKEFALLVYADGLEIERIY